jgi:multidrug resistance efflux pump
MEIESRDQLIELHSDEVQEILGKPPRRIVSLGIILLFILVTLVFFVSWLFKYPDVIVSEITVTTENVPANLVAKSSGKITGLYVDDKEQVDKGQIIAVIENTAATADVLTLKGILRTMASDHWLDNSLLDQLNKGSFVLGEIEPSFALFRSKLEEYIKYSELDYSEKKIASIENQIVYIKNLIIQIQKQVSIQNEDLCITKRQFLRDSTLNIQKFLSIADVEKSKMNLLQKSYTVENAKSSLMNAQIQYSQLEQQVLELRLERSSKNEDYELSLKQYLSNLNAAIALWDQKYVLNSPVAGRVTFSRIWSIHQNVAAGDLVVTIIPSCQGKIIGILKFPLAGSGKVKPGQKVNVRFTNYPDIEFGMVIGTVEKIALVPNEKTYLAEVVFPNGLVSNYGKKLMLLPEMTGSAEIITEDMRLIERFFNPMKSLFKQHL